MGKILSLYALSRELSVRGVPYDNQLAGKRPTRSYGEGLDNNQF
jgi:hypothetical protein